MGSVSYIDETFDLKVDECKINSVTPSKTLGPYNYIYDDPQYSEALPAWTIVPDCNWIPTYTVTANSPFSDIVDVSDNTNLKHATQDVNLIDQTFSVTVIAAFPDPNAATHSFTIQYTIVDPCPSTIFSSNGACPDIVATVNGPI